MLTKIFIMWVLILGCSLSEVYCLEKDLQKGTLKSLTGKLLEKITSPSLSQCSNACLSKASCDFFFFSETIPAKDESNNCHLWTESGKDKAELPEGYDYYFYVKQSAVETANASADVTPSVASTTELPEYEDEENAATSKPGL